MKKSIKWLFLALPMTVASHHAAADWSATITAASDYTFNGVSQTGEEPTIQASIDKALENGVYFGSWASNVDFGEGTRTELDFYVGRFTELDSGWGLDYGIAYYTYHGADHSDEYNYPEAYMKFSNTNKLGQTELNFWYSWDYFGTEAGHAIVMVAHTYEFAEGHALKATFDVSNSTDLNKWAWDGQESSYRHYRFGYQTEVNGFNMELAFEKTSLEWETADPRFVLSFSKTIDL